MYARIAGVLLLPLALLSPVFAGEENWVGKKVVLKEGKIKIGFKTEDGGDKAVKELSATTYTVLEDRDGFLKVRESGTSAWFPKGKALLPEEAVDYFTDLIARKPGVADTYKRRAAAFHLQGDLDAAIKDLDEAIRLDPKGHAYWNNRGMLFSEKGDYEHAIKDLDEAIRLNPKSARSYSNRAYAYGHSGDVEKAIKDYGEAIRLQPDYAHAYLNRGFYYASRGDYPRALADYDSAIRSDPELYIAYNNKADALACSEDPKVRDGAKAVELAKTACRLSKWKNGICLDTLACAYAEAGQFDEAVKWQKKALEDPEYARKAGGKGRMQLQLFEAKKPFHYGEGRD